MLSEVLYYLDEDGLAEVLAKLDACLARVGHVIAVHWRGETDYPLAGDRVHELHAEGGDHHPHVHGANLGVRADAYVVAGGFAPLATGEDHALWRALADRPRVATRRITVVTSARRRGRAPDGSAGFLVALAAG